MTDRQQGEPVVLDAHVHLWDPSAMDYPWLNEAPALKRAFDADDFAAVLPEPADVIVVEAGRHPHDAAAEVEWVRAQAVTRPWIRGIVAEAPVELRSRAVEVIRRYATDPFVLGVRRNVQDEPAGFTTDEQFRAGVRLLGEHGLPFDACVRDHQLAELAALAQACPQTTLVLDHLGKPAAADPPDPAWRQALRELARHDNVVCKLSGLATEAAPGTARPALLATLREALQTFGPDRCLFGGDWPVMTLATDYQQWLDLVREALADLPTAERHAVLRTTAERVYGLAGHHTPEEAR
ncbi:amidohydrolase family protein [Kitasatospora viridis]|uniref:L-fuconolactonase n=1 Tax=Kitasatospora viridis TaxID=281105 RepID=A0A561TVH9_9ACTN|nr:amidohydrolase family protein [Kitasatospora viridis]TWF91113.1 L-fuconolactonase [Kitasatospora viridis]